MFLNEDDFSTYDSVKGLNRAIHDATISKVKWENGGKEEYEEIIRGLPLGSTIKYGSYIYYKGHRDSTGTVEGGQFVAVDNNTPLISNYLKPEKLVHTVEAYGLGRGRGVVEVLTIGKNNPNKCRDIIKENDLGELIKEYPDGVKKFLNKEATLKGKEAESEFISMCNVIKSDFVNYFNSTVEENERIKKSDVEFDEKTGDITVWTGHDPSFTGNWDMPVKMFFKTNVKCKREVNLYPTGMFFSRMSNVKFEFEYLGGKN